MKYKKVGCVASSKKRAQDIMALLRRNFNNFVPVSCDREVGAIDYHPDIDLFLVMGGDGFMLDFLRCYLASKEYINKGVPIYGLNCGSIGFLLNDVGDGGISYMLNYLDQATIVKIIPLSVMLWNVNGQKTITNAINEVSVLRDCQQATHMRIYVNGHVKIHKMVADGIIISSPIGSTAYNMAAGGPILHLDSNVMPITGINTFSPKGFKSALVPDNVSVKIDILDLCKRSASVSTDSKGFKNIKSVSVMKDESKSINLLFNTSYTMRDKIFKEQFSFH